MWKTFNNGEDLYMIKIKHEETVEVLLTDLKNLWLENLSTERLLEKFQESNPLFEIKVENAVTEVCNLVHDVPKTSITLTKTADSVELGLQTKKSEFKMSFKFNFDKLPTEAFFKELTVPLVQTVKQLEEERNILRNLILKKDRELEEYKLEKGSISRGDLITEKFDESVLGIIDNKSMLNVFNSEPFWTHFSQQHGKIDVAIENVQVDPWNQVKRKKTVYSSKTAIKKGKGIDYSKNN